MSLIEYDFLLVENLPALTLRSKVAPYYEFSPFPLLPNTNMGSRPPGTRADQDRASHNPHIAEFAFKSHLPPRYLFVKG